MFFSRYDAYNHAQLNNNFPKRSFGGIQTNGFKRFSLHLIFDGILTIEVKNHTYYDEGRERSKKKIDQCAQVRGKMEQKNIIS